MKLTSVQKAFLAIIIANVIWGSAASIFKISLTNIPPFTLAFWRFFLGAILLFIVMRGKSAIQFRSPHEKFAITGYALAGITVNIIFFFLGLTLTQSINAPIIASSAPIMTFLLARVLLKERTDRRKIAGMLLGTIGIVTIVLQPLLEQGVDGSVLGNFFLIIATLGAVVQTIIHRRFLTHLDPLKLTYWAFVVGSASFLPLAIYEYIKSPILYELLDWRGYMGLGFGAILSSALAYSLYAFALTKITATDSSLFTYLDPVIGTVLGAVLLQEPITWYFLLGATLIFSGIFWAEGHLPHYPIHKLRRESVPRQTVPVVPPMQNDPHVPNSDKRQVIAKLFDHPKH